MDGFKIFKILVIGIFNNRGYSAWTRSSRNIVNCWITSFIFNLVAKKWGMTANNPKRTLNRIVFFVSKNDWLYYGV